VGNLCFMLGELGIKVGTCYGDKLPPINFRDDLTRQLSVGPKEQVYSVKSLLEC